VSWVIAFVGFAALIVLHEFGHFAAAKAVGMRVERFALFFPPLLAKVKRGETEYGIGAIPLGGYVKITGMNPEEEIPEEHQHRAYYRQPVWKRIVVIAAGPLMNVLVAFLILTGLYATQTLLEPTTRVGAIELGSPAQGALQAGDRVISVDGKPTSTTEEISRQVGTHRCPAQQIAGCTAATPATLVVERGGERVPLRVTPKYDGELERVRLGFGFQTQEKTFGVGGAAGESVSDMWGITTGTVEAITRLFYDAEARKEVSGVVGSYETTRQSVEVSWIQAMNILAIISLSLAIVNLFPFLPLDGGHIFWATAEKLRRKPIPFRVMERASVVGFLLVIFVFAIGLSNDIGRLRGEGFGIQ
jgi:regulator of sigma E protease